MLLRPEWKNRQTRRSKVEEDRKELILFSNDRGRCRGPVKSSASERELQLDAQDHDAGGPHRGGGREKKHLVREKRCCADRCTQQYAAVRSRVGGGYIPKGTERCRTSAGVKRTESSPWKWSTGCLEPGATPEE
ncbi:hypothetical protein GN956_G20072 [Arapaima gigas]